MKHVVITISDWRNWIRGLIGAVIGGAANAITVMVMKPEDFNFAAGGRALAQFAGISALISAALYLKQSPLPKGEEIDSPDENQIH